MVRGGAGWNGQYQNKSADTAFFPSEIISIQDFLRKFVQRECGYYIEMARCSSQILFQNVKDNVKCNKYLFQEKGIYHLQYIVKSQFKQ